MAEPQPPLTEDQLKLWKTPREVLDLLPDHWSLTLKQNEIATRIQAGTIKTAALRYVNPNNVESRCAKLSLKPWEKWGWAANDGSASPFWEGASDRFYTSAQGYGSHLHQLFGIRLDPADISAMFLELGVKVSANSPTGCLAQAVLDYSPPPALRPLPTPDAASLDKAWAWFNALPLEDQQRPWRWLWPKGP